MNNLFKSILKFLFKDLEGGKIFPCIFHPSENFREKTNPTIEFFSLNLKYILIDNEDVFLKTRRKMQREKI